MATPEDLILKNARAVAIIHADRPAEADAIEELALWALELQKLAASRYEAIGRLDKALNLSQAREAGTLGRLESTTAYLKVANGALAEREKEITTLTAKIAEMGETIRGQIDKVLAANEGRQRAIDRSRELERTVTDLVNANALLRDQRDQEAKRRKEIAAEAERARQMQSMIQVPPITSMLTRADVDFGDPKHGHPGEAGHVVHERFGTRRGAVIASEGEGTGLRVHSDAVQFIEDFEAESFDVRNRLRNASEGR